MNTRTRSLKRRNVQYNLAKDYYKILGIEPQATQAEIQQAYRQKAKELHPDRNPDQRDWATQQFQLLNEAYDVLGDPARRSAYDAARFPFRTSPRSTSLAQDDWWNIPHPAEPGYRGVRSRPPRYPSAPPRPRPGAWLEAYHLGLIRPFYAGIVDLIYSPYRYVLFFLLVIAAANVAFILLRTPLTENPQRQPTPLPTLTPQPTVQPVSGIVPASDYVTIQPCPTDLLLQVVRVERQAEFVKITAQASYPNLNSRDVQWVPARVLEGGMTFQLLGEWEPVNLIFQVDRFVSPNAIIVSNVEPGEYLLHWTSILPGAAAQTSCDQVIAVPNG